MESPQEHRDPNCTNINSGYRSLSTLGDIAEEDLVGVTTLNMYPSLRSKMYSNVNSGQKTKQDQSKLLMFKGKNANDYNKPL